ncbi:MAG: hypothetical protein GF341_08895, partial [candidate division Zixibacteria bacterium]|nr:hypothetical protein [candidate division Zixibacteria bacterium]
MPRRLLLFMALLVADTAPADYVLDWWTLTGGGGLRTSGGSYELSGSIGLHDAGTMTLTDGTLALAGGFWAGVSLPVAGDCNKNGILDF